MRCMVICPHASKQRDRASERDLVLHEQSGNEARIARALRTCAVTILLQPQCAASRETVPAQLW